MNLRNIKVIVGREYMTRVKKKSFLITTFVVPILFAALCILPSVLMMNTKEKSQKVAVVDQSGIVMPYYVDNEAATYTDVTEMGADIAKEKLSELGMDVLVVVSPLDTVNKTVSVQAYSKKPIGVDFSESLGTKATNAVEDYRIKSYNIDNLDQIMKDVKARVRVTEYTMDESGKESVSESAIYMVISMVLGMIIYMFIAMFGAMVMTGVIEEKSSRVVEVLISSVKATELMFGKIIGVALVALTQFLLWIVFTLILVLAASGIFGMNFLGEASSSQDPTAIMQSMGVSADQMDAMGMSTIDMSSLTAAQDSVQAAQNGEPSELSVIMGTLGNIPYVRLIICFLIYFVLGYLLYASLYAAVGSAVENEADTQQLQLPITIPLMIAFFIVFFAFRNPDSGVVFWGSMIPFTSPIVMIARIPYGVPMWELIVSIALLVVTFIGCAWLSAKIYKVGILMFGKKSTYKDLWKWLKQ
ncbi:MAG: ABC transporter permease [Bacteroidales bacterium]|nr:ABC transporter permease [Bacteroidales bacterium]